jgi:Spy/CpxP family protein refolding chaperone
MIRANPFMATIFLIVATPALAQHAGHGQQPQGTTLPAAPPYAGQDTRVITSLSADDIEGYRAGRGMGLAKPAELNGFPGPMHVLELGKDLALTDAQRAKVQAVMDSMKAKGRALGEKYVAAELAVDAAFRSGAKRDVIAKTVAAAGRLLTEIRLAHLNAHLEITPLLSKEQRTKYAELRGYGSGHDPSKHKN